MSKVYLDGYVEAWVGFSLTGDPEVMYSAIGLVNTVDWTYTNFGVSAANDILTACYDNLSPFVPSAYTLNQSFILVGRGQNATDDIPPLKYSATIAPVAGTHAGATDSLPQNNAWLVRKNVTDGKPGRMFIPGVDETKVSNTGTINNTEAGLRQSNLTQLQVDLEAVVVNGATGVVAMMSKNRAPLVGYSPKEITNLTLDNVIATQRRRLRK